MNCLRPGVESGAFRAAAGGLVRRQGNGAVKPNFIGIGAQKCASTWLYRILADHPEAGVSAEKEVDFFSYRFDHGYRWYESRFAHFAGQGRRAIGEISPSYFCDPAAAERVARYVPDAKIVVSLRDPVERAISNHRHEVRVGHVPRGDASFESGLANNPMYIEQGLYAKHLRRWMEHFPPDRILVVLVDDIRRDHVAVTRIVYDFLDLDPSFVPPSADDRVNRSFAIRYRRLSDLKDRVYRHTGNHVWHWGWRLGTAIGLRALYRGINIVPSEDVIAAPRRETIEALRRTFEPEIRELERITGRNLERWLG